MKHLALGIDLVFCLIVLPLMAALSPIERWVHNFTAYMLLAAAWLYAVYIANRAWAVPLLFGSRRKKACGVLIVLASLASAFLLTGIELYEPKPNIHDAGIERRLPQVLQYQQALWTLFMLTEAFSFAVGLLVQADVQRARRRAAEAARDRAEIELYKAQIKPHFMFNTLNSLYGLFLTGSERALPSLEKFIQMMKYVHLSSARTIVPLSEEAEYIRRYADVQSLRLGETARVHLDISVPPLHAHDTAHAAGHVCGKLLQAWHLAGGAQRPAHQPRRARPQLALHRHQQDFPLPPPHRRAHGHRQLPQAARLAFPWEIPARHRQPRRHLQRAAPN